MQPENKDKNNSQDHEIFLSRKRLAPPPPVITDIDQRINKLEEKGKKRGRRNSWIGILGSLAILLAVFAVGYYLLGEISRLADKVEVGESAALSNIKDPDGLCSVEDDCCLTSLSRSRKNGYMLIDELGVCPEGSASGRLKCSTSLTWCEPLPQAPLPEETYLIDKADIDMSDWAEYGNSRHGFSFPYPETFFVDSSELEENDDIDIKKLYVKESATSSDYYFILKIIENTSSSTLDEHIAAQKKVLDELASSSGVTTVFESEDYRTEYIEGKKIRVVSEFKGGQNENEEVLLTGNGRIFAMSYPVAGKEMATGTVFSYMKGMVTSFKLLDETGTSEEGEQTAPLDKNDETEAKEPLDSDGDGLSDDEEVRIYGTDPYWPDTDNDGFSDGDEVRNGYNPKGPGLL